MKRVTALLFLVAFLLPASAQATFPGANGKIAFVRSDDIWTMNPDGSDQVNLTNTAAVESNPAWSPDGKQIAFDRVVGPGFTAQIFVMAKDGSGVTPIPNASGIDPTWSPDGTQVAATVAGFVYRIKLDGTGQTSLYSGEAPADPEWSPDGTQIAVTDDGPSGVENCFEDIYLFDAVDGSDFLNLTCGLDDGEFNTYANWSPDAQRVAYGHDNTCTPGPTCPPPGITTVKRDGTDRQFVHGGETPAWSPDGQKFVFGTNVSSGNGDVWTVNADGTGALNVTNGAWPDWQPIPINAYPRPRGATPLRVSLVPAYDECTSPNRTHGAPLAFSSCTPPELSSQFLTVGTPDANGMRTTMEALMLLKTVVATPSNSADVKIVARVNNVANKNLTDYTGSLHANLPVRITDKLNSPHPGGPGAATTQPFAYGFDIPCASDPDPLVGSDCSVITTANTLLPGTIQENLRAVWQLGQVRVFDGGPDADGSTPSGNTVFAVQGVFVP